MDLVHEFAVPAPAAQAWDALTDIPRIAGCLPGAALDQDSADPYTGTVTVKVGAMTIRFRGEAEVTELDPAERRMTLQLRGKDVRGASSATASIIMRVRPGGSGRTNVHVTTSLELKGKVAQFGRGALQDVSNAILQQFVQNLEAQLASIDDTTAQSGPAGTAGATVGGSGVAAAPAGGEVLDLGGAALPVLLRRYGTPLLAGAALVTAVVALARTFGRRADTVSGDLTGIGPGQRDLARHSTAETCSPPAGVASPASARCRA